VVPLQRGGGVGRPCSVGGGIAGGSSSVAEGLLQAQAAVEASLSALSLIQNQCYLKDSWEVLCVGCDRAAGRVPRLLTSLGSY
jgi:hypothetical protein